MSFRKPFHMPFRKLIPPFTLTASLIPISLLIDGLKTGFKLLNGQDEASRGKPIVPIVVFAL